MARAFKPVTDDRQEQSRLSVRVRGNRVFLILGTDQVELRPEQAAQIGQGLLQAVTMALGSTARAST